MSNYKINDIFLNKKKRLMIYFSMLKITKFWFYELLKPIFFIPLSSKS